MARPDIFQNLRDFKSYTSEGQSFQVPIRYRRLDCFFAVYTADYSAVRRVLPSPRLHAVKVWPGRAAVALNAFDYQDTDIGPYGEFSVGIPCTCRHGGRSYFGIYVHRLPVTTEIARAAGIAVWGYPKFIAEMEFANTPERHSLRLTAGGRHILDLQVNKGGFGLDQGLTLGTFTVKDREIIFTRILTRAMLRARPWGQASLQTGPHEMGGELQGFDLSRNPIATGDFLDINLLLPEGESLGPI